MEEAYLWEKRCREQEAEHSTYVGKKKQPTNAFGTLASDLLADEEASANGRLATQSSIASVDPSASILSDDNNSIITTDSLTKSAAEPPVTAGVRFADDTNERGGGGGGGGGEGSNFPGAVTGEEDGHARLSRAATAASIYNFNTDSTISNQKKAKDLLANINKEEEEER